MKLETSMCLIHLQFYIVYRCTDMVMFDRVDQNTDLVDNINLVIVKQSKIIR